MSILDNEGHDPDGLFNQPKTTDLGHASVMDIALNQLASRAYRIYEQDTRDERWREVAMYIDAARSVLRQLAATQDLRVTPHA